MIHRCPSGPDNLSRGTPGGLFRSEEFMDRMLPTDTGRLAERQDGVGAACDVFEDARGAV